MNPFEKIKGVLDNGLRRITPEDKPEEDMDINDEEDEKIKQSIMKDHPDADPEVINRLIREEKEKNWQKLGNG